MFRRDFMPRSHNATLEQREGRFYGVRVNVAMRIFPRVIHGLVKIFLHLVERPRVDGRFIGHNHFHMAAHVGIDNLSYRLGLRILGADKSQIAVALPNADNHLLDALWAPAASLRAYVGLINLDSAAEFFGRY